MDRRLRWISNRGRRSDDARLAVAIPGKIFFLKFFKKKKITVAIYANATWADRHVSLGQRDKLARDAVATSREFDPETSRPARHGELLRPRPVQSWKNAVTISASSFDPTIRCSSTLMATVKGQTARSDWCLAPGRNRSVVPSTSR